MTTHACHPSPGEAEVQISLQIQGHRGLQSGILSQSIRAYQHQTVHHRAELIRQNVWLLPRAGTFFTPTRETHVPYLSNNPL